MSLENLKEVNNQMSDREIEMSDTIIFAISGAPSLKKYRKLIKDLVKGELTYGEILQEKGIIFFDDPHQFGFALNVLSRIFPYQNKESQDAFEHELDHHNEARELGANYNFLGLLFGVKGFIRNSKVSFSAKECHFTAFNTYYFEDIDSKKKKIVERSIARAPKDLSWADRKK